MTFIYLILLKIIGFNIFLEFLSFIHKTLKLNISINHTKYLKKLALCYTLFLFINIYAYYYKLLDDTKSNRIESIK